MQFILDCQPVTPKAIGHHKQASTNFPTSGPTLHRTQSMWGVRQYVKSHITLHPLAGIDRGSEQDMGFECNQYVY